jgi:hypothetical protein
MIDAVFQSNSKLYIGDDLALTGVYVLEKVPHKSLGTVMFGGVCFDQAT